MSTVRDLVQGISFRIYPDPTALDALLGKWRPYVNVVVSADAGTVRHYLIDSRGRVPGLNWAGDSVANPVYRVDVAATGDSRTVNVTIHPGWADDEVIEYQHTLPKEHYGPGPVGSGYDTTLVPAVKFDQPDRCDPEVVQEAIRRVFARLYDRHGVLIESEVVRNPVA
jgi:hypothetical protein